jgi:hypothetical protein
MKLRFLNAAKSNNEISAGMGEFMVTDAKYDDLQSRYLSKQQHLGSHFMGKSPSGSSFINLATSILAVPRPRMHSSPTQTPRHFPHRPSHDLLILSLNFPPIRHTPPYAPQARHIDDLLMPTQQHAHRRTTTLALRARPATHLRESRARRRSHRPRRRR